MRAPTTDLRTGSRLLIIRTQDCLSLGQAALSRPLPTAAQEDVLTFDACHTCLALVPGEGQQLLVGSTCGRVLRGARLGEPPPPRQYKPEVARPPLATCSVNVTMGSSSPGDSWCQAWGGTVVTSLAVSPAHPTLFLAGHSTGSLALHLLYQSTAVRVWRLPAAERVVAVRWSPVRACVALVVDAAGLLSCFDFARSVQGPVATLQLRSNSGRPAACVAMELSPPSTRRNAAAPTASVVVAFADGAVQWHRLPRWLVEPQQGDADACETLLLQA